jgi:hypothetical protein
MKRMSLRHFPTSKQDTSFLDEPPSLPHSIKKSSKGVWSLFLINVRQINAIQSLAGHEVLEIRFPHQLISESSTLRAIPWYLPQYMPVLCIPHSVRLHPNPKCSKTDHGTTMFPHKTINFFRPESFLQDPNTLKPGHRYCSSTTSETCNLRITGLDD